VTVKGGGLGLGEGRRPQYPMRMPPDRTGLEDPAFRGGHGDRLVVWKDRHWRKRPCSGIGM